MLFRKVNRVVQPLPLKHNLQPYVNFRSALLPCWTFHYIHSFLLNVILNYSSQISSCRNKVFPSIRKNNSKKWKHHTIFKRVKSNVIKVYVKPKLYFLFQVGNWKGTPPPFNFFISVCVHITMISPPYWSCWLLSPRQVQMYSPKCLNLGTGRHWKSSN